MFNIKKAALVAGLGALLASTSAFAADNKVYFQVHGGWAHDNSMNANQFGDGVNTRLVTTGTQAMDGTHFGQKNFSNGDFTKKKSKYNFGAAVGYQVDNNVRLDLAYTQFNKDSYSLTAQGNTLMTSAFYIPTGAGVAGPVATEYAFFTKGSDVTAVKGAVAGRVDMTGANASLKFSTVMLNGYYDFAGVAEGVTPYVNLGLGMANVKITAKNSDVAARVSKNKLAYQAGVGVAAKITDQFTVDLGYRFNQVKLSNNLSTKKNINHQTVNLALRVSL